MDVLTSYWAEPCTALEKLSDVVYRVGLVRRNRVIVLHHDWLAPYHPLALALPDLDVAQQVPVDSPLLSAISRGPSVQAWHT